MAPEQVEGLALTPAADVYALGIVTFEMVTGRLPFIGETSLQTALKRLTEPAPSARSILPELPASWDAALARCLQKDPRDRFADPRAFVAALSDELAIAALPAPTKATSTPTPSPTPVPSSAETSPAPPPTATAPAPPTRAPLAVALAAVALALVAGGAWILHRRGGPPSPPASTAPAATTSTRA